MARVQAPKRAGETATPADRRWRMPWTNTGLALVAVMGMLLMLYPNVASWFAQYNQSTLIQGLNRDLEDGSPTRLLRELQQARLYNDALTGGALVSPDSNVPTSDAERDDEDPYHSILDAGDGLMGRLRIESISVDLPIYHGTSEEALNKGVGHLEGTSLPVGGASQHSVLTAHRGLPEATLFDDLHKVRPGETFSIEVFGEVLVYRVTETHTVLPHETQALLPRYGQDVVTLVTCTPLGLNTHRYLVTGERVLPTPIADIEQAGDQPRIPGFPWWAVLLGSTVVAAGGFIWRGGYPKGPRPRRADRRA